MRLWPNLVRSMPQCTQASGASTLVSAARQTVPSDSTSIMAIQSFFIILYLLVSTLFFSFRYLHFDHVLVASALARLLGDIAAVAAVAAAAGVCALCRRREFLAVDHVVDPAFFNPGGRCFDHLLAAGAVALLFAEGPAVTPRTAAAGVDGVARFGLKLSGWTLGGKRQADNPKHEQQRQYQQN